MASTQVENAGVAGSIVQNKPKGGMACMACRAIKTKCNNDSDDREARCSRCVRLDIECVWFQKKRGRKSAVQRAEGETFALVTPPSPVSTNPQASTSSNTFSHLHSQSPPFPTDPAVSNGAPNPFELTMSRPYPPAPLQPMFRGASNTSPEDDSLRENDNRVHFDMPLTTNNLQNVTRISPGVAALRNQVVGAGPDTSPGSASLSTGGRAEGSSSKRRPRIDVAEILDPHSDDSDEDQRRRSLAAVHALEQASPSARGVTDNNVPLNQDDPVLLNMLSEIESIHLVDQFFKHLNPLANVLDPDLHTFQYVRTKSTPLFTMVLAASAKFFRPRLYSSLSSHGQTLINRATASGICNTGLVQALAVAVYWKEPQDTSVWIKIGLAIRLACQLGWHFPPVRPLPKDMTEARERYDAERTWMNLICFDQTYSDLFRLPRMIRRRDIPDPIQWALGSELRIQVNVNVACSVDHLTTVDLSDINDPAIELSPQAIQISLEQKAEGVNRLHRKWFGQDGLQKHLHPSSVDVLRWLTINRMFKLKAIAARHCLGVDGGISESMTWLVQVVEHIEIAARDSRLVYAQDILACSLSEIAVFAHSTFSRLSPAQQTLVISLLKRVHHCCPMTSEGSATPATAFVARFIERTLRNISTESRVNTRPSSPVLSQPNGVQSQQFGISANGNDQQMMLPAQTMQDLDDFLATFADQPQSNDGLDSQYWSSLFSSVPDFRWSS